VVAGGRCKTFSPISPFTHGNENIPVIILFIENKLDMHVHWVIVNILFFSENVKDFFSWKLHI
jgi:hypothetical protein